MKIREIKNIFTESEINSNDYKSYIDLILKATIQEYQNISLDPDTQHNITIILKGLNCYITGLNYGLLNCCSSEKVINDYLASLLCNTLNVSGYNEATFINDRKYNFDTILNCNNDDIEINTTVAKLITLLKAVATSTYYNNEVYFIQCNYDYDYIEFYNYANFKELNNNIVLDESFEIEKDNIKLFNKVKSILLTDERVNNIYININDYQNSDFALGRVWSSKDQLIQQIYAWYDYEIEADFDEELQKMNIDELIAYINDMWSINIVVYDNNNYHHNMLFLEHYKDYIFKYESANYEYIYNDIVEDTLNDDNYLVIVYGRKNDFDTYDDEVELYHYELTKEDILDYVLQEVKDNE